jgi:hypothetical protein
MAAKDSFFVDAENVTNTQPDFFQYKRQQIKAVWYPESFELSQLEKRYYTMRAYNTNLSKYVTWESVNEPDLTAFYSGYPLIDLNDIGVIKVDIRNAE